MVEITNTKSSYDNAFHEIIKAELRPSNSEGGGFHAAALLVIHISILLPLIILKCLCREMIA